MTVTSFRSLHCAGAAETVDEILGRRQEESNDYQKEGNAHGDEETREKVESQRAVDRVKPKDAAREARHSANNVRVGLPPPSTEQTERGNELVGPAGRKNKPT